MVISLQQRMLLHTYSQETTMKTNRGILLAFLAIILIGLTACSGSGGDPVTAKVFVNGTAMSANTKAVSDISFASASIIVGGDDITGQLEPVGTVDPATGESGQNASDVQSGNNNVEFDADVPVTGTTVIYEVQPRPGFVFDEWEIMRWKLSVSHETANPFDYPMVECGTSAEPIRRPSHRTAA